MHRITTILAGVAASALLGTPALAAGAQRVHVPEDFDGTEHFAAGDGPCVPWAGTFHEVRHGGYDVLLPPGGQVDGEAHVNGTVFGHVDLVPDDPRYPSYAGDYREKDNAIVTSLDEEDGDTLRIAQYRLRIPMTGTDGSGFVVVLSGKFTMNARGDVTVAGDVLRCDQRGTNAQ